jgi:hypothetical protein
MSRSPLYWAYVIIGIFVALILLFFLLRQLGVV